MSYSLNAQSLCQQYPMAATQLEICMYDMASSNIVRDGEWLTTWYLVAVD
jgi:hypothetical protein